MRDRPIAIQLVTRSDCHHCTHARQTIADAVTAVGAEFSVQLTEVDLTQHPDLLDRHDIWATPALIVDGELAFVGNVSARQLRMKLALVAAGH